LIALIFSEGLARLRASARLCPGLLAVAALFGALNARAADEHVIRASWNVRIAVLINGTNSFSALDETINNSGHVALWTEEDNVTRFDRLTIKALPWCPQPRYQESNRDRRRA
jgi:hypothetical protein